MYRRAGKELCPIYSVPKGKVESAVAELCANNQLEVLLVEQPQDPSDAPISQICTPHQPRVTGLSNSSPNTDGDPVAAGVVLLYIPSRVHAQCSRESLQGRFIFPMTSYCRSRLKQAND